MIKHSIFIVMAFSAIACSTVVDKTIENNYFKITDFSQGKMKKENDKWVIYEKTNEMRYEINDKCIYKQREINCLRHGFAISYDSKGADVELKCLVRTHIKVDAGSVGAGKKLETYEDKMLILLKGNEKIFSNPQYVDGTAGFDEFLIETSCYFQESEVLNFSQKIHMPKAKT
ncbi:MAG: hypothetical protein V4660_13125 [Pseudomonadota bacterium]